MVRAITKVKIKLLELRSTELLKLNNNKPAQLVKGPGMMGKKLPAIPISMMRKARLISSVSMSIMSLRKCYNVTNQTKKLV